MVDVKDIFGTQIKKGHVVLISKGERGRRDFSYGIVIHIDDGKTKWITAAKSYQYKGAKREISSDRHMVNHTHNGEINKFVIVVLDVLSRPVILDDLIKTVPTLIDDGILPQDYQLGQAVEQKEDIVEEEVEKEINVVEPEIFAKLGLPKSLLGAGVVKSN